MTVWFHSKDIQPPCFVPVMVAYLEDDLPLEVDGGWCAEYRGDGVWSQWVHLGSEWKGYLPELYEKKDAKHPPALWRWP